MSSTAYDKEQDARIKKLEDKVFSTDPPPIPPTCGPDPDPNDVHLKEGGWGGDMASASQWDAVPMKDDPSQWKVVDKAGVNIAHKFASEAEAEEYITYHRCMQEGGTPDPGPTPEPEPEPPEPEPPGPTPVARATPYPVKGTPLTSSQRGPTERHYQSGKPDDWTIEKNVKGIPFPNYQWVTYVTMGPIEHDDTISVKFGGHHTTGSGWYDCGISFGEKDKPGTSQTCLGTEPMHPSTNLCIVKGPKLMSVLGKKTGVAGVYFTKENKIELWIDEEGGPGWKKVAEGVSVGGLKPKPGNQETQLRIDGFNYSGKKDEPDMNKIVAAGGPHIHSAIVTEI